MGLLRIRIFAWSMFSKGPDFQCGMGLQFTIKTGGGIKERAQLQPEAVKILNFAPFLDKKSEV